MEFLVKGIWGVSTVLIGYQDLKDREYSILALLIVCVSSVFVEHPNYSYIVTNLFTYTAISLCIILYYRLKNKSYNVLQGFALGDFLIFIPLIILTSPIEFLQLSIVSSTVGIIYNLFQKNKLRGIPFAGIVALSLFINTMFKWI